MYVCMIMYTYIYIYYIICTYSEYWVYPKWMVYHGTSQSKMDDNSGCFPIYGSPHLVVYPYNSKISCFSPPSGWVQNVPRMIQIQDQYNLTGWWFGCHQFGIFPYIGNNHPN